MRGWATRFEISKRDRCEVVTKVVRSELLHAQAGLATLWAQMQGGPGGMDAPLPWHSPEVQLLDVQLKIAARQLATAMGRVGQNLAVAAAHRRHKQTSRVWANGVKLRLHRALEALWGRGWSQGQQQGKEDRAAA